MFLSQFSKVHSRTSLLLPRSTLNTFISPHPHQKISPIQARPLFSWLFNPTEEVVAPKKLTPLKLDESGKRLLFWDSTHTTPLLKPEFNERHVTSLSTGISHGCAVVDGNVHTWGSNYYSQVGLTTESYHDDDSEDITDVHFVSQLANEEIIQVASGSFHNLALSKSGKLWSWGSGCLGRGDEIYDSLPQPVEFFHALGRDIKKIYAAGNYSMALVTPKGGQDDELYIWGYIPFGEENQDGEFISTMKKSLRPLLITSVLGYNISHVACSPWHCTIAATPATTKETEEDASTTTKEEKAKPLLMTFGRYMEGMPLEKPYSPLFLDIPPEDEFYDIRPWRTFRSVSPTSDLVIKKMSASKGCDIVLMENGEIGVSDHEDMVARLIHRPLDFDIVDIAGGSSEVIFISEKGQVLSWSEPIAGGGERESTDSLGSSSSSTSSSLSSRPTTTTTTDHLIDGSLLSRFNNNKVNPSTLHPLSGLTKDEKQAESEVLAFFDSQRKGQEQKKTVRLVEALFGSSTVVVDKPGLSKCVAHYDRFTVC